MNKNIFVILALTLVFFSNTVLGAGWAIETSFSVPESNCFDALVANGIEGDGTSSIYMVGGSNDDVFQLKWNGGTSQWDTTTLFNGSSADTTSINTGTLNGARANPQLYFTRSTTSNCVYEIYYAGGWSSELIDASCAGNAQDSNEGDGRGTGTNYLYVTDSSGAITEYSYSGGWNESPVTTLPSSAWGITIANADPASPASKQLYVSTNSGSIYKVAWDGISAWEPAEEIISGLSMGRHIYSSDIDNDGLDEIIYAVSSGGSYGNVYIIQWDAVQEIWTAETLSNGAYYMYNMSYGDADNDGSNELYYGTDYYWWGAFIHDESTGTNTKDNYIYKSGHYPKCAAIGDADNDGLNELYTFSQSLIFKAKSNPISVSIPATRQEHDFGMGCDYYTDKKWSGGSGSFTPLYSNTTYWIDNTPSDNDFSWNSNSSLSPGTNYSSGVDVEYWHTNKPVCANGKYTAGNYRYDHKFPSTNYWGTDYVIPYAQGSYPNTVLYIVGLHDNTTYSIGGQSGNTINTGERNDWNDEDWGTGNVISADKPIAIYLYYNSPLTPNSKLGQSFFIPPHTQAMGAVRVAPSQNNTAVYVDADNNGVADETYTNLNIGSSTILINTDAGTHVYADKPIHLGIEASSGTGIGWDDILPVEALGNAYFIGYSSYGADNTYAMAIEPNTKVESHREKDTYDSTTLLDFGDSYNLANETSSSTIFGDKPFWYGYYYAYGTYTNSTSVACPMSQVAENRLTPRLAALGELQTYGARLFTMDVSLADINGTFYIPDDYTLQGTSGVTITVAKYGANSDQLVESTNVELTIPTPSSGKYTLQLDTIDAPEILDALLVDQYLQVSFDASPNSANTYELEPAEFGYTADTYTYSEPLA